MNECHFLGRLAQDPEVKYLQNGTAVTNFSVAVSRKYKTREGQPAEEVCFVPCEAWAKGAETIGEYFSKGDPIIVHCSVKQEQWETDGQKRSKLVFRVNKFEFVPGNKKRQDGPASEEHEPAGVSSGAPTGGGGGGDDEIPF